MLAGSHRNAWPDETGTGGRTNRNTQHLRVFFILPVLIILLWLLSLHSNDIYFSLRTSNIAIVISLLSLLIFSELITRRKRNETGRLLCAITFFVTVLLMIYRMVSTQYLDVPIKLFDANSSNIILMFGMGFTLLVTGISVLIISSQWLQNRLFMPEFKSEVRHSPI